MEVSEIGALDHTSFWDELSDISFLIVIAANVSWVLVSHRALLNACLSCLFSNLKPELDSILGACSLGLHWPIP